MGLVACETAVGVAAAAGTGLAAGGAMAVSAKGRIELGRIQSADAPGGNNVVSFADAGPARLMGLVACETAVGVAAAAGTGLAVLIHHGSAERLAGVA